MVKTETSSAEPNTQQFGITWIVLTLMVWYLATLFRGFLPAFLYKMSINFSLSLSEDKLVQSFEQHRQDTTSKIGLKLTFLYLGESLFMDLRK